MKHDQVTKFTQVKACVRCGRKVLHHQVADFDRITGFKITSFTPTQHRCTPGRNAHDRTTR